MKVTYLNSLTSTQIHAAAPLFEARMRFPSFTDGELGQFLQDIEARERQPQEGQDQAVPFISINNEFIDPKRLIDAAAQREPTEHWRAIAVLDGIAEALPVAFDHCGSDTVAGLACYEAAGLLCSSEFRNAAQSALRQAMNPENSTVPGHIAFGEPTQMGMNIVPSDDGKALECHITAAWNEYVEGGKWHRMNDQSPVLTAKTKAVISLRPLRSRSPSGERQHQLECTFAELRANSPLPGIVQRMVKHKATIRQLLANALANLPLFGMLFRGTRLSVEIGSEPPGHRQHAEPADLAWRGWDSNNHEKHIKDAIASSTYVAVEKLRGDANAAVRLHAGSHAVAPDVSAPLRVRIDALRNRPANDANPIPEQAPPDGRSEALPDPQAGVHPDPDNGAPEEPAQQQIARLSAQLVDTRSELRALQSQNTILRSRHASNTTTAGEALQKVEGFEQFYPKPARTGRSHSLFGNHNRPTISTTTTTTTPAGSNAEE